MALLPYDLSVKQKVFLLVFYALSHIVTWCMDRCKVSWEFSPEQNRGFIILERYQTSTFIIRQACRCSEQARPQLLESDRHSLVWRAIRCPQSQGPDLTVDTQSHLPLRRRITSQMWRILSLTLTPWNIVPRDTCMHQRPQHTSLHQKSLFENTNNSLLRLKGALCRCRGSWWSYCWRSMN